MARFGLKFALPVPGSSDVAQRELTVTVNEAPDPFVRTYTSIPTNPVLVSDEWVFDANDRVVATLVDIDEAGNRSPPSAAFTYTVIDDVPPTQPGELGVIDKHQID